jgi:hypothetical protein
MGGSLKGDDLFLGSIGNQRIGRLDMNTQMLVLKRVLLGLSLLTGTCLHAQSGSAKLAEGSSVDPKTLHEQKVLPLPQAGQGAVKISPTVQDSEHPGPSQLVQPQEKPVQPQEKLVQPAPTQGETVPVKEAKASPQAMSPSGIAGDPPGKLPAKTVTKDLHGLNAVQLAAEKSKKVVAIDLLQMDPSDQQRILRGPNKVERSNLSKDQVKGMSVTSRLFIEQHPTLFNIQ